MAQVSSNTAGYVRWALFIVPTVLIFYGSLYLTVYLRYPAGLLPAEWQAHLSSFSVIFGLWLVVMFIHGLFDFSALRRYYTLAVHLVSAMSVNFIVAVVFFYFQPDLILTPRRFLLLLLSLVFVFLLLWNVFVKYAFHRYFIERVYLCCHGDELEKLRQDIENHSFLGYSIAGTINASSVSSIVPHKHSAVILSDLFAQDSNSIKELYELRKQGMRFYNHRVFFERLMRKVYLEDLHEAWFLENIDYSKRQLFDFMKRAIDIAVGLIAILVFAITFPFLAVLVKLSSSGPVLFVQPRIGARGKIIKVYKYRTMKGNAGNTWTAPSDPRITPIGKFLRLSRLDELPQCLNLLRGDMSLVGPRPEQVHIVEQLRSEIPFYDERHSVKPGITGWAQLHVYASTVEETREKLAYDLYYIKHRSLLFDLEVILKTGYVIVSARGR